MRSTTIKNVDTCNYATTIMKYNRGFKISKFNNFPIKNYF